MIFESPDGGKTVYARKPGETGRVIYSIDEFTRKESILNNRVEILKQAVYLDDPVVNDLVDKIILLMELKK